MVKTYSLLKDGDKQLSLHFKAREFRCHDGSDTILIADELIDLLEKIRKHFDKPVNVTSGYRTVTYNKACGGAPGSQHLTGKAADIIVQGINPLQVCRYAEILMPTAGGIGYYVNRFSHVDVRSLRARWKQNKSGQANMAVSGFAMPVLKRGMMNNQTVQTLQLALIQKGYRITADGDFGTNTFNAVVDFQRKKGLKVDGLVGNQTWLALDVV